MPGPAAEKVSDELCEKEAKVNGVVVKVVAIGILVFLASLAVKIEWFGWTISLYFLSCLAAWLWSKIAKKTMLREAKQAYLKKCQGYEHIFDDVVGDGS